MVLDLEKQAQVGMPTLLSDIAGKKSKPWHLHSWEITETAAGTLFPLLLGVKQS